MPDATTFKSYFQLDFFCLLFSIHVTLASNDNNRTILSYFIVGHWNHPTPSQAVQGKEASVRVADQHAQVPSAAAAAGGGSGW